MKKQFYIKGLHCASCVYTTEKALKKINGVSEAVVNLATGTAVVQSSINITNSLIKDVIKDSGYEAIIEKDSSEKGHEHNNISRIKNEEMRILKIKMIFIKSTT